MKRPDFLSPPNRPNGSEAAAAPAAERRLQRAVREASMPPGSADEVDALSARVLARWRELHTAAPVETAGGAAPAPRGAGGPLTTAAPLRRRLLLAGTAGLAAAVALTAALIASRPDPALEELMQPDVLSQLAIGEM